MPASAPTESAPDTKRLALRVDDRGRAVIRRAVTLYHATHGVVSEDDPDRDGEALAEIVGQWLTARAATLREAT